MGNQERNEQILTPKNEDDVTLENKEQKIIIETKYYSRTLTRASDFNKESFHSADLYQLFSYRRITEVQSF